MQGLYSRLRRIRSFILFETMHTSNSCKNLCSTLRRCLAEEPDIEKIEEQTVLVRCVEDDNEILITTNFLGTPRHYQRKKDDPLKNTLRRMYINLTHPCGGKKLKKMIKQANIEANGFFCPDDIKLEVQKHCSAAKSTIDIETSNIEAWKENHVLMVGDEEFKIRVNAPTVASMSLPNCLMVGFPVVPHLELEFGERYDAKFMWFRAAVFPQEEKQNPTGDADPSILGKCCEKNAPWEFLTNTFKYTPTVEDIGYKLKFICIPRRGDVFGFSQEAISKTVVGAGPGECPFEERHLYTMKRTEGPKSLRVMSYNILADLYADTEFARTNMYPYCSPYAMAFDYRGQLILKEILGYNSDVICLQECDLKVFTNFLQPALREEGFEGNFLRKAGEMPEGEAIFYHGSRFQEIKKSNVIVSEALYFDCNKSILDVLKRFPDVLESLKKRTAVGQIIALKDVSDDRVVCILNTHLYFRPEAVNIRLLQIAILLNHFKIFIDDVSNELEGIEPAKKIAPIVFGDLNSTPKVAVIEYLTGGKIDRNHSVWDLESGKMELELVHDFEFFSACGYPEFTNYVVGFKDTLDYIMPDGRYFKVESCIPFPDEKVLELHTALPSVTLPSDHLALVCDIAWKD